MHGLANLETYEIPHKHRYIFKLDVQSIQCEHVQGNKRSHANLAANHVIKDNHRG